MATSRVDYDSIAPVYDQRYRTTLDLFAPLARWLVDVAGGAGREVLEVGCGTGHWLGLLAGTGARVHGLDASAEMLAGARARVPDAELVHGTAEQLPWPAARFDRVLCINAIHHFPDKPGFVREAARVLRPGGQAVVVGLDPHRGTDRWWAYHYFPSALALDRARMPATADVEGMLTAAGLTGVGTSVANHVPVTMTYEQAVAEGHTHRKAASQLTLLADAEYDAGIAALERDVAAARDRGETHRLDGDLTFYATVGTSPPDRAG